MRLLRAHFENFRLLRDLELDFSGDPARKLTVIRAANETGKTTILHALQWCLYGDAALPNKGVDFRLHPIDWDTSASGRVPITATVEFEVTKHNRIQGGLRESRKKYRIIRSAFEDLEGTSWTRAVSTVRLYALHGSGAEPIDAPEALINEELPPELREVFFTDGDRALSFIESDVAVSTKRDRVLRAIRSLLGLGLIEESTKHVRKAAADVNRQARMIGGNTDLTRVAERLERLETAGATLEAELADANQQFMTFDEHLREVDRKIDETLRKGDRERLRRDLETAKKAIVRLDERLLSANKEHSALFRKEALARDVLAPILDRSFSLLKDLHDKGKIPSATIPVLQERLATSLCICGESLADDGGDSSRRREHVQHLIEESEKADAIQEIVTDLYYGSRSL
jgi:DNA sulfur modification protein DndD